MNIAGLAKNLPKNQKDALNLILNKLFKEKKVLSTADVGLLGVEIDSCIGVFVQKTFGIGKEGLRQWVLSDCPRNKDGTYNLKLMIEWKLEQERNRYKSNGNPRQDGELQKLRNQNRKLELEIETMEKKTMPREEHSNIMHRAEREIKLFFTEGYKRNAQLMMKELGLSANKMPEFLEVWDDYIKQAMDAFLEGVKE